LLGKELMMTRISLITLFVTFVCAASSVAQPVSQPAKPRDSRLNGFLIGLAAGAVPGIMLGMGIRRYCENEATSCPSAVPIFGVIGGLGGGAIGFGIDSAIHQSPTFGRPRPSPGVRFSFRF
jgi:hypothetical protein